MSTSPTLGELGSDAAHADDGETLCVEFDSFVGLAGLDRACPTRAGVRLALASASSRDPHLREVLSMCGGGDLGLSLTKRWRVEGTACSGVALAPNTRLLAAWAHNERHIEVRGVHDGCLLHELPGPPAGLRVSWSPNGRWLSTGSQVWCTESWKVVSTIPHTGVVNAFVWSPDGHCLVTCMGGTLFKLEVGTWRQLHVAQVPLVVGLRWLKGGRLQLIPRLDSSIFALDLETGEQLGGNFRLSGHDLVVRNDGIAAVSDRTATRLVNLDTGAELGVLAAATNGPGTMAWSTDGQMLAVACGAELAILRDDSMVLSRHPFGEHLLGISWSNDGTLALVTATAITLFDSTSSRRAPRPRAQEIESDADR